MEIAVFGIAEEGVGVDVALALVAALDIAISYFKRRGEAIDLLPVTGTIFPEY
jgi:hypothetical protein